MGNNALCNWLQELQDTQYIVRVNAENLRKYRSQNNLTSSEIEPFLREREGKLLKLISRILYLKLKVNSAGKEACKLDSSAEVHLWLEIVNLRPQYIESLLEDLKSLDELLSRDDESLNALCDACNVTGEDRRRFIKATQNLRWYTNLWIGQGAEPKDELPDAELAWIGYDRSDGQTGVGGALSPGRLRPVNADRDQEHDGDEPPASRRPSAPGKLVVSLPASPTPTFSPLDCGATAASTGVSGATLPVPSTSNRIQENRTLVKPSSTPPPCLRWATASSAVVAGSPQVTMIRSRSHESNLPKKIIRSAKIAQRVTNLGVGSGSAVGGDVDVGLFDHSSSLSGGNGNNLVGPGSGVRSGSLYHCAVKSKSSSVLNCCSTNCCEQHQLQHCNSGGNAATLALSPDSGCESCSATVQIPPRSPRTNVRMLHNISHRFVRMWKPSMSHCHVCLKPLGLTGEKCSDCKMKIHSQCKDKIGPTCGLTTKRMRQIYELLVLGNEGSWDSNGDEKRSPRLVQSGQMSGSFLNAYPDRFDSASSSSCNSSAPSTPAPVVNSVIYSPGIAAAHQRPTFSFTEFTPDVPLINIDSQSCVDSQNSLKNESETSTLVSSSDGNMLEMGSESHFSNDDNFVGSTGSADEVYGSHQWRRNVWSVNTIRGGSTSWREWTIPIEEISFKKDSLIGRGRFGDVHAAYWHQDVAVKLLNMDHVANERQLETFKLEVSTFRNTRHENLVLFLGCCLKPPSLGIVMNLCKGRTLHTLLHLRRERMETCRIVNIATQISQGMSYLHGKKIVHKDLRTKNIFIENNNKVVITDFGLFSIHRLLKSQTETGYKFLCVPKNLLGYLSPEIMRNLLLFNENGNEVEELPFSTGSDVYALGTVWYELITGEYPFKRSAPETIIWQVGKGIKPALNNLQLAKEMKEICMLCWKFRPNERPDFNALLKMFDKLPRKRLVRSPSYPSHVSRSTESLF
ncbi:Kinase suppressor of Ras 2 [Trichinella pseudospiralis]|uniref:Kinase suppressor of Ras 2 n=1 Tax=Trichinella pseudospiralis TaxID=6337 RepID=A0A0V1G6G2_TRIPS|nr:Kinase suppressor of Ras 2 [Trichinella pseudospiralis]